MPNEHKVTIRITDELRTKILAFRIAVKMGSGVAVSEGEAIRTLIEKGLGPAPTPTEAKETRAIIREQARKYVAELGTASKANARKR